MSPSRVPVLLLVGLLASGACVDDVYLGPEPAALRTNGDAGGLLDEVDGRAEDDAGTALGSDADAGPTGGEDASVEEPRVPEFCGINSCLIAGLGKGLETCERGAPSACWPSSEGYCELTCNVAQRCGREDDARCPDDTFCNVSNHSAVCNELGTGGYCTPYPKSCANEPMFPVCGCDGATYESECLAARAGMSVASLGACDSVTTGP